MNTKVNHQISLNVSDWVIVSSLLKQEIVKEISDCIKRRGNIEHMPEDARATHMYIMQLCETYDKLAYYCGYPDIENEYEIKGLIIKLEDMIK